MYAINRGLRSRSCGRRFRIERIRPTSHGIVLPVIKIVSSSLIKVLDVALTERERHSPAHAKGPVLELQFIASL